MKSLTRRGLDRLSVNVKRISEAIGTPFYAYDWPTLETSLDSVLFAASEVGLGARNAFCLAFFSLPNAFLFEKLLKLDEQIGISCNTNEEILALKEWGCKNWDRIVFSGGVVPAEELQSVASTGCLIHVASIGNLEVLLKSKLPCRLGLRLDLTNIALKGIRLSEIDECFKLADQYGKEIDTLHAYPGTRVESSEILINHAEILFSVAAKHKTIKEANLGGGFDYDYTDRVGDIASMVDFSCYFTNVRDLSERFFGKRKVKLTWEPGRVIFAGAGFFVMKVLEVYWFSVNRTNPLYS